MDETLLLTLCNWSLPGAKRAQPPYLYRPTMQVVQPWLIRRELPWFGSCLSLLPALVAAVFCERAGRVKDRAGAWPAEPAPGGRP